MMEKWEDLKIYRNLPPEEIPTCFKEFAHFICDKLSPDGFRLKESKSEKRLFRFNADFEQTIYFENTSRVKNQKEVRIYVSIKPLFTDKPDMLWRIFQGFEVTPTFKMDYPLTKEYLLLAAHLLERIQQYILPFFDQYATVDQVVTHHQKLLTHYKLPHDGSIPENATALRLIYESAFRCRNKDVFTRCYMKYLQQTQEAYAQFKNMRLPTEHEWEIANTFFEWGKRWEWTRSAYQPYPNFAKDEGALGEYNGKFMINQLVLRGSSEATAPNHSRATYRNFFHADKRWQYTGIRLVK